MIKIICSPCKSAADADVFHLCVGLDVRRLVKVGNWCTCQCRDRIPPPEAEPTVMEIPKFGETWLRLRQYRDLVAELGDIADESKLKVLLPESEIRRTA